MHACAPGVGWASAVRHRDHAAHPLPAVVVWNLSDPTAEEELHVRPLYRRFVGLDGASRIPDETAILRFRHLLEKHQLAPQVLATTNAGLARRGLMLKIGTVVDTTIIAAPSSTKNKMESATRRCTRQRGATSGTSA